MRQTFMYLEVTEPSYTDALDDTPYVFEFAPDNTMDGDDPESDLRSYLNQVGVN